MKRNITAIFLVIAIMFGNMFIIPVSAAGLENEITIEIGSAVGDKDSTKTVAVSITNNTGISAFELAFTYDPAELQFVSAEVIDKGLDFGNPEDETGLSLVGEKDGLITAMAATLGNNVTGDGKLFELTFKLIGDEGTTANIELSNSMIERNKSDYTTNAKTTSGTIYIKNTDEIDNVVSIENVSVATNTSIKVPVTIMNPQEIYGYELEIEFDNDNNDLKFEGAEFNGLYGRCDTDGNQINVIGLIGVRPSPMQRTALEEVEVSGTLLTLEFSFNNPETLEVGDTFELRLTKAEAIDEDSSDTPFNFVKGNGSITVIASTGGLIKLAAGDSSETGYVIKDMGDLGMILTVPGEATQDGTLALLKDVSNHTLSVNVGSVTAATNSAGEDLIGTGMVIELKDENGDVVDFVTVIKYGDVLGKGYVGIDEAICAFDHYVGGETLLIDIYLEAGKVLGDDVVDIDEALEIFDYYAAGGTGVFLSVDY